MLTRMDTLLIKDYSAHTLPRHALPAGSQIYASPRLAPLLESPRSLPLSLDGPTCSPGPAADPRAKQKVSYR